MPQFNENEKSTNIMNEQQAVEKHSDHSELKMIMQRITEQNDGFDLTERQIDQILDQRKEINGFIHKERMQEHERFKWASIKEIFIFIFIIILIFSGIILLYKQEYFTEVLGVLLGFAGGYGYATSKAKLKQ